MLCELQEDPLHLGGWLSGELHGKRSTRIAKRYRLIFTLDEIEKIVYLNWHKLAYLLGTTTDNTEIYGFARPNASHFTKPPSPQKIYRLDEVFL